MMEFSHSLGRKWPSMSTILALARISLESSKLSGGKYGKFRTERPDGSKPYGDTLPEGSALVEGEWWPKSYEGPPLISLDREAAKVMNVGIGDTLVVSVLGREIEARIASLRSEEHTSELQ